MVKKNVSSRLELFLNLFSFTAVDHCHSNPCENNGTCHNSLHGYQCSCPGGFHGTDCEEGNKRFFLTTEEHSEEEILMIQCKLKPFA